MKPTSTPTDATLETLRKKTRVEIENLIEDAKEALKSLQMDEWEKEIYESIIKNAEKVLAEKK